jgi:hypothetical protein
MINNFNIGLFDIFLIFVPIAATQHLSQDDVCYNCPPRLVWLCLTTDEGQMTSRKFRPNLTRDVLMCFTIFSQEAPRSQFRVVC